MATIKQKAALKKIVENRGNVSKAMIEVGYSKNSAKNPKNLTKSKGWKELVDEYLPDKLLTQKHKELLNATGLDHMIFPLGPDDQKEDEPEEEEELEPQPHGGALKRRHDLREFTELSDKEIIEMLKDVNCTVRKIVHGEQARHVYFWASDNKSRLSALDLAYKIKGKIREGNTFINAVQNNTTINLTQEQVNQLNSISAEGEE